MVTTPVFEHLFNIGQGLKSFDTSGNHRHSVLSGNPSWVAGRKGKAIALDGTDDAFVAPVPSCDNEDFTVGFWVQNWLDAGATGAGILALQSSDYVHVAENCLVIYRAVGDGKIKVACYDSSHSLTETLDSGVTASSGFMCVRRSGDTVSFFLNGAFVAEATVTDICAFTWLLVGHTSYGYAVADWIDKIRYWDSALSDEEIEYWYAKDKPRWADSCVLWLRGDEENGAVVSDASPQGNDGTLNATLNDGTITGATWVVDEEKGKSLSFDGNDIVSVGAGGGMDLVSAFTVVLEFKPSTVSIAIQTLVYRGNTTPAGGFAVNCENAKLKGYFYDTYWRNTGFSVTDLIAGRWYHVALTYDKVNLKLYVDAVLEQSPTYTTDVNVPAGAVTNIGAIKAGMQHSYGEIRNVRFYSRALSATEIEALYTRSAEVSYSCVAKWLLNEGSGSVAYDSHNRFPAKRGNGINFNGVAENVLVADNDSLDITESITCIATIKTTKTSRQAVIAKASAYLFYVGTIITGRVHAYIYGDNTWRYGNTNVCDGEKHFIAVTYQPKLASDNMVFYVDGEQDGVTTGSGGINTSSAGVGVGYRNTINYYDYFQGLIDEAMVFNQALSATEIKRVYEADGFLDYIPLSIQDGSLTVSVDSVGVQWDSWAGGACRRKHLGLGKNVAYTFTAIEEVSDVPWLDSAAYILKEKKDSGTPVDLYIKKTDVLAAESTSVVIDSMTVRYSPTMQVRYIDFSVREQ